MHTPIRRRATTLLAAVAAMLLVLALPAVAGSSLSPSEVPANTSVEVMLTVTEPDPPPEGYIGTRRVRITAPEGFVIEACDDGVPIEPCDGSGRTWTARRPVPTGTWEIRLQLATPGTNGTYDFVIVQSDGGEEPIKLTSQPRLTVTGGQDPPEPEPSPEPSPTSTTSPPPTTSPAPQPQPSASPAPAAPDGDGADDDAASADTDDDSASSGSSGGSTAPRRTQGRSSGTSLDVQPRATDGDGDEPAVAAPDVAGDLDPTVPSTSGTEDESDGVAASAGPPADGGDGEVPWQQPAGAALVLGGVVVLVVWQWGQGIASATTATVQRARDLGGDTLRRLPRPWGR